VKGRRRGEEKEAPREEQGRGQPDWSANSAAAKRHRKRGRDGGEEATKGEDAR